MNSCENSTCQTEKDDINSTNDAEILAGAKLSEGTVFVDHLRRKVNAVPVIVEFRRLIQCSASADVVPGVFSDLFLFCKS